MKLKVSGVETVMVNDPNKVSGHRRQLDKALLKSIKGRTFTAKQLKHMFGYSQFTSIHDTQLSDLIEPVEDTSKEPYSEKSTKWRVK